tara:strand:- start:91 stop:843 length:753 start_codon:yes stop_codon:yes gene_type:complete
MVTVQSEYGRISLFDDFCGPEIPIGNDVAYGTTAGGCHYYIGPYKVTGDMADTDAGVVGLSIASGAVRLTGTNEAGEGCCIGTEAVFSPSLNGTLVAEARVQTSALTARFLWFGFCDVNADVVDEPVTSATATLTLVASDLCGFLFDSQLTAKNWHMPYNGGTTTGATDSTTVDSEVLLVVGGWDILRIEIAANGTAFWYVNGVLKQTVANAVSTTVLQACYVGSFATTTTVTDIDVDYLAVSGNRDWTV